MTTITYTRAALASSLDIPRKRTFKRKYPSSSSNDDNDNSSNDTSNDNSMSVSPPPSPSPIATLAAAAVAARAAATPAAPAVGSLEWRRTAGLGTGGAQSAAFKQWERAAQQSGSPAAAAAAELLLNNTARLTAAQGQRMLAETLTKYLRARVEPGEVSSESCHLCNCQFCNCRFSCNCFTTVSVTVLQQYVTVCNHRACCMYETQSVMQHMW
jgi:hypothetical protein